MNGDVKSREQPDVAPDTVTGSVKKLSVRNLFGGILIVFLIYLWIAVTLGVALARLLVRAAVPACTDAAVTAGRRFWPTVGWGALISIVGPILAVLVMVTIIGIPFGLGMLSALNVLAPLGYVASSLIFGRLMVKGTTTGARIGAFFAGFGILRAVALLPVGFIAWVLVPLRPGRADAGGLAGRTSSARRATARGNRAATHSSARGSPSLRPELDPVPRDAPVRYGDFSNTAT